MASFKCKTPCYFGERFYTVGEIFEGNKANKHFEELDPKEDREEIQTTSTMKNIRRVLESMDHDDNKVWTMQDLPVVKIVEEMVGVTVSRDQINEAFPGFKRDTTPLGQQKAMTKE